MAEKGTLTSKDSVSGEESACPTSDLLAALLAGQLAVSEAALLQQHLDRCEACLDLLVALAPSADGSEARVPSPLDQAGWLTEPPLGGVLHNRFLLVRQLGRGATAVVYQAEDRQERRVVALKLLRHPRPEALWRFKREFRLCRLLHPSQFANVHELFTDGRWWWFTMELVEGTDLLSWLAEAAKDEDAIQLRLAFTQLATGLQALHEAGFVHRDVKGQNLRVTPSGRVILIDLGLATEIGDSCGDVVGTPAYMSPEQTIGSRATPASDWYSFGVLLRAALDRQFEDSQAIPEDLLVLHRDLTRTDPTERPEGPQIIGCLGALTPAQRNLHKAVLDGEQTAVLEELMLALSRSSASATVVLELPGTESQVELILHGFAQRTARMGPAVLWINSHCSASEQIPLATLDGLLDVLLGIVRTWSVTEQQSVLSVQLTALWEVFPSFLQLDWLRSKSAEQTPRAGRVESSQLCQLLSLLFQNLSLRGPLILVLQECQCLDRESAEILENVLSASDAPNILLLLTGTVHQSPLAHRPWRTSFQSVHCSSLSLPTSGQSGSTVEPSLYLALAVSCPVPTTRSLLRQLRQALFRAGLGTERLIEGTLLATLGRTDASTLIDLLEPTLRFAEGLCLRTLRVAMACDPDREHALKRAYHRVKSTDPDVNDWTRLPTGLWLDSKTASLRLHRPQQGSLLLGRPTSFQGRSLERDTVLTHLHRCATCMQPEALVVTGEPGLGKTRLCHESLQAHLPARAQLLQAECDPSGPSDTLGLIRQTLRRLCCLSSPQEDVAGERAQVARFRERIARGVPIEEVDRVVEFLGEVCLLRGLNSTRLQAARADVRIMQQQVQRAVCDFLRAECELGPVVWFIDNLHWADAASLRLIREALHALSGLPLALLATARPEIHQRFPWLLADPRYRVIPLSALEDEACRQIVAGAVGDALPTMQVHALIERAGGNPLFLEELIRAVSAGHSDPRPDSVRILLHGRLSRLPLDELDILSTAGVLGTVFSSNHLVSVWNGDPVRTDLLLESLVQAEWLAPAQTDSAYERSFRFRHALLREVAYERLSPEQRQQRHLKVGRFLGSNQEADPLRTAQHLEQGGDRSGAAKYYGHAAERALGGGEHEIAEELARRGISCDDLGIEQSLLVFWMEAHGWRRDSQRSLRYIAAVLDTTAPGTEIWLRVQILRQMIAMNLNQPEQFVLAHQDMLSCSPTVEAASAYGYAFGGGTFMMLLSGQLAVVESSIEHLTAALTPYAEQSPVVCAWIDTCRSYWAGWCRDDPWSALGFAKKALDNFGSVDDVLNACIPKVLLALHSWTLGSLSTAAQLLAELVEENRSTGGFREIQPGLLAVVWIEQGKLESAHTLIQRFLHRPDAQERSFREGWVRWALAEYHFAVGDLCAAEREVRLSIEQLSPMLQQQLPVRTLHAEVLLKQGRVRDAIALATDTLATYRRLSALGYRGARAERVCAEALLAGGRRTEAESVLLAARDRIHTSGSHISDEAARHHFLTAVTEHRRIVDLLDVMLAEEVADLNLSGSAP